MWVIVTDCGLQLEYRERKGVNAKKIKAYLHVIIFILRVHWTLVYGPSDGFGCMQRVVYGPYDEYNWMRSVIFSEIYRANNYMLWSHCSFNKECSGSVVECSSRDLEVLVRRSPGALCCALEQMFLSSLLCTGTTQKNVSA